MNRSVSILHQFKPYNETQINSLLNIELQNNDDKIVVLDDDPTGVQTVHDVSVYTDWSLPSILCGFEEQNRVFFILTNSRSMTATETTHIHLEIAKNLEAASKKTGRSYMIFSRSDSTLRGHFPLETDLLMRVQEENGKKTDGEILCPYFKEGGRFTIDSIHYVQYGDELMPASETEFAKDITFGYTHSYMPQYIEEKTAGRIKAEDVICISLSMLRNTEFDVIEQLLLSCENGQKVVVDAIEDTDLKVFSICLYRAIAKGKRFIFRTAAGLVKVMAGIDTKPLLTRAELVNESSPNGGLIVVGSHTQKTTRQLQELLKLNNTVAIPFQSSKVKHGQITFDEEIHKCVFLEEKAIRNGKTAVVYTERNVLSTENLSKEEALKQSVAISEGVQKLVSDIEICPSFIIAKGGITSSDIGTKALNVKRATVIGQIIPGVPVWETGNESRFPSIPYVIFPGNVGNDESLKSAAEKLIKF